MPEAGSEQLPMAGWCWTWLVCTNRFGRRLLGVYPCQGEMSGVNLTTIHVAFFFRWAAPVLFPMLLLRTVSRRQPSLLVSPQGNDAWSGKLAGS